MRDQCPVWTISGQFNALPFGENAAAIGGLDGKAIQGADTQYRNAKRRDQTIQNVIS